MKREEIHGGERTIKRYDNRKLYDPSGRRYVTLDDLARRVGDGEDLRVVDQRSGEDLTTLVLAQVLLESIRQRTARIPRQVLARLIRLGSLPAARLAEWGGPQEAAARARQETERLVSGLLGRGRLSLEEALALRQGLSQAVLGIVADAQRRLEGALHGLLDGAEGEGVSPALHSLRERLLAFETFLEPKKTEKKGRPRRDAKAPRTRGAGRFTKER